MVNDDDVVFYFLSVVFLSIVNGFYYYGVEVFYSELVMSVYFKYRECYGKLNNEDFICSFFEIIWFFEWYKNYFSILVGIFWKEKCVYLFCEKFELFSNIFLNNF